MQAGSPPRVMPDGAARPPSETVLVRAQQQPSSRLLHQQQRTGRSTRCPDGTTRAGPDGVNTIEEALAALGRGEMVVVIDDPGRENEGNLIMAAEKVTPAAMAFMIRHSSGVVCAALPPERLAALQIPLMVAD